MASWNEVYKELSSMNIPSPLEILRKNYLTRIYEHTKRNLIFYAANWTQQKNISPDAISISEEDIQGFVETISGLDLENKNLDLILHSPGGLAEVVEQIVKILRSRFDNIRVIIPFGAMSAATMFSCSANKILMAEHSFLGPTDPQFILQTQNGLQAIPAQAILDQFEKAKNEIVVNKSNSIIWLPMLQQYGPALLTQCENAIKLSKSLVSEWLSNYMLSEASSKKQIGDVANALATHTNFNSHSRHIDREKARQIGLNIENLENDAILLDRVSSLYNATTILFDTTAVVKLIENQNGIGIYKSQQQK
jgi:ATP-dependent protease ClpP protease subunit